MSFSAIQYRYRVRVLAAMGFVVILAGLLVVRIGAFESGGDPPPVESASLLQLEVPQMPPPAYVPEPGNRRWRDVEVPCWSCPTARNTWPIRFQTDLDLLAPLGTGSANAAEFFALFAKDVGPRSDEAASFLDALVEMPEHPLVGKAARSDDPLLAEAEPWVDQASMAFYPETFPLEGWETRIPNLLMMLNMARSWTWRGLQSGDLEAGLEDCRRAVRMGRLLRQEDVVIINDLVGLACIHVGARGMLEIAQRSGNADLAMVAASVVGEVAPQRFLTSQRITSIDITPHVGRGLFGRISAEIPESKVAELIRTFGMADRRFRGEAILTARMALQVADADAVSDLQSALEELAQSEDALTAEMARYALDQPLGSEEVAEALGL